MCRRDHLVEGCFDFVQFKWSSSFVCFFSVVILWVDFLIISREREPIVENQGVRKRQSIWAGASVFGLSFVPELSNFCRSFCRTILPVKLSGILKEGIALWPSWWGMRPCVESIRPRFWKEGKKYTTEKRASLEVSKNDPAFNH